MKRKAGILMIGVMLLLEGILLPCISINKRKPDAANNRAVSMSNKSAESADRMQNDADAADKTSLKGGVTLKSGAPEKKTILKKDAKIVAKAKKIYKRNRKLLVLVNAGHALTETYQAALQSICNGRLNASSYLYHSLTTLLADAGREGFSYWIASAWRSKEKQQRLIDEDVRKAMQRGLSYNEALLETYKETMPAGHSEHETGLALDILCSGNMNMDASQAEEAGNIWLRENCFRYGFILRYPEEKEDITGVNYEPWHLRYVGKEAAAFFHKHDLTLEEYWQLLS